jgi:HSP20 family protein
MQTAAPETKDTAVPELAEVRRAERTRGGRAYRPNVDIFETSTELTLVADMPGVRGEDVDINFENGVLTIYGPVKERQPAGTQYLLNEFGIGDFYRTFEVGEAIDSGKIAAEYKDGVLTLHLPKVEAARPRRIAVKTQ